MELSALQRQTTLLLRHEITATMRQYVVHAAEPDDTEGPIAAFAELRETTLPPQKMTLHTDASCQRVLAEVTARKADDPTSEYDVLDHAGAPIGMFRADVSRSPLHPVWRLQQRGLPTLNGRERNPGVAVLRRFTNALPWVPYHFDFSVGASIAFCVEHRWGPRDRYQIEIRDPRLDRRLVIAMAIALDSCWTTGKRPSLDQKHLS